MIIVSFLTFAFMLVWMIVSVLAVALGFCCADLWAFVGGIFSLVCWYQVLVWGEPWFRVLAQAWM